MIPEETKKILEKQHYRIVGKHSAVQICRWTKKSLRDEGVCYKEKFYGIKSHLCCQMTPAVMWCPNKCLHCWRAVEHTIGSELKGNVDSPSEIIDSCIKAQRKLLEGFNKDLKSNKKQMSKANQKKYYEAQEPMQFAISLSGEPTVYPKIGGLIEELRKRKKTSFLVTNGMYPEKILELKNKNQLPTQLYVSVNASNKEVYEKIVRSSIKNPWEKLNETLSLFPSLKKNAKNFSGKNFGATKSANKQDFVGTRTIFRMNLIRDLNMDEKHIEEYAELIKKANPLFVEIKGYMSVGYARERLGYDRMPTDEEMKNFVEKLATATGLKILDSHEFSRAFVLGKRKEELKIKKI